MHKKEGACQKSISLVCREIRSFLVNNRESWESTIFENVQRRGYIRGRFVRPFF